MTNVNHGALIAAPLSKKDAINLCLAETKGQGRRLLSFLNANPDALTHTIRHACGISNLSDAVGYLNLKLSLYGWQVVHEMPEVLSRTRRGRSMQRCWRIARV